MCVNLKYKYNKKGITNENILKIVAGMVVIVVVSMAILMYMTSGMSDVANKFFTAVKSNDYDKAYSLTSENFKRNTSQNELKTYLVNNALNNFKEASWDSRSINNGRGELIGSIITETGGVVPIALEFIKGENDWKIFSMEKPLSGIQGKMHATQMPSKKEQIQLVKESIHIFAVSIKEQNMSKMFNHASQLWQQQTSVAKLDKIFNSFYEDGDMYLFLDNLSPQFTSKTTIDENGVLLLQGIYPTPDPKFHFKQKYVYEDAAWKLLGFNISIK